MTAPIQQTEELKEELVLEYKSRLEEFPEEERADRTMDVVKELATEYGMSPNGIRMILMKRNVYIKKSEKPKATLEKPKRMSKEAAHAALKDAIEAGGCTADMDVISKLSGVAAQYLASTVITILSK